MTYFRVKKLTDIIRCGMLINNGNLLAAGELYTPTEVNKALHKKHITQEQVDKYLERIELKPQQVTKSDGARFISI